MPAPVEQEVVGAVQKILDDDVNFLRIGGKVYTLTDRGWMGIEEQFRRINEYFEAKVKDVVETYRDKVKVEVSEAFERSGERLVKWNAKKGTYFH